MQPHWSIVAAATAALAFPATAQEAVYDFVACTHSKISLLESGPHFMAYGAESWGTVASSTTKGWENASTRCLGYARVVAGKPYGKGTCKWVFATGDSAVGEYEYGEAGAKFTWLAGTGKLKGIEGGGTFKQVFSAKPSEVGTAQGCRRDWGKYKLPVG